MKSKSKKTLFVDLWRIGSTFLILIMLVFATGVHPADAAPLTDQQFSAWSGDVTSSTSPVAIQMDGNMSVTTRFADDPPLCTGILYVDVDSTEVTPNGCSWAWAFRSLQDALAVAPANGSEIWVAEGTYYPDEGTGQTDNARTSTFELKNGVAIYGGFAGNETALIQRDPALHVTILSGDIDQGSGNTNNAYHVVRAVVVTSSTILDGFTITGGYANSDGFGGGMYNENASPILRNMIISANVSTNFGGGMYSLTSASTDPSISSPQLINVTFTGNTSGRGGGLSTKNSNAILTDVVFTNNTADSGAGGGMNNQTASTADPASVPLLTNVTFNNNTARGGGGLYNNNSNPILTNVTFVGNTATIRGGGIFNEGASPVLKNVTMSGNTAPAGFGGAIHNVDTANISNPVIYNSILWGDIAGGGADEITIGAGLVTISNSVIENGCQPAGSSCTNIVTGDPVLGTLGNNGGYTQTMALGGNSSAIDVGSNATCAPKDQRGIIRPQGLACDAGAYEVVLPPGAFSKSGPADGLTGTAANSTLGWLPSNGVDSYEYCYDTTDDDNCSGWTNNGLARTVMLSGLTPATTYYWQARAVNSTGVTYANGSQTSYWSFTTANLPGTFGKAVPASGQTGLSTSPSLTWGGSSEATTYEYCYDTTNDGACSTWTNTGGARNVTLSGLNSGTTYYWQVRASNTFGTIYANGSETAYWSFTTTNLPGAFGKIILANGSTGISINPTLTWGGSSEATTYEYCYDTTNDGSCGTWTNNGGARNVTLTGLAPATTYYWQVRAKNSFGTTYANGAETAYWSFTTVTPPGVFGKGVPASGQIGVSINPSLTWGGSSGVSTYEYCYDTTDDGSCSTWTNTGGARNVTLSGLNSGTTYYWQVRAINSVGTTYANGSETAYWSFTTVNPPGAFVKAIPASGQTGLSVNPTLIWGASSGASIYEYCYDTTDDGTCSSWVSTGGARYVTLSGLTPATTYYWQVRAINSVGITYANGSETAYWSFTTITPPGVFGKGIPANGQIGLSINPTLTWGASSGANTYEYCYDTTDDGACSPWTNNGGTRYVFLSGLTPSTTYYWQVRAINSTGTAYANGSETVYWSFTTANPPGAFGKGIPANGSTGLSTTPTLIWGPSSGAITYEYCYDTTDDGACGTWVNNGGARYVTLSGLTPGTIYYWQVRAKNSFGITYANGSETAYWNFTITP